MNRFIVSTHVMCFAIAVVLSATVKAQSAEDSVKATVNLLFTAMRNADATTVKSCFADSAILQTITRSGSIRTDNIDGFAQQIARLPKDSADERIRFDAVKIDGDLASVWTPYQFYYAGSFSHCGVNSFQLVRTKAGWKIQYLIDTRRRINCL